MHRTIWLLTIGWLLIAGWSTEPSNAQVVWIDADVVDYRTHQIVGATWQWIDSLGNLLAEKSVSARSFSGYVPIRAHRLRVSATGYRLLELPIHWVTPSADPLRFRFTLSAVPVDKPTTGQPYFQSEQKPFQLVQKTLKPIQVATHIQTLDVLTKRPVPAEICLFFTRNQQKMCYSSTQTVPLVLRQPDIIAFEVRAPGYQPYLGNLVVGDSRSVASLSYVVRLNPIPTLLIVPVRPGELLVEFTLKALRKVAPPIVSKSTPAWVTVTPDTYRITTAFAHESLQTDTIDVKVGINLLAVTTKKLPINEAKLPCEIVLFAQSSYELSPPARIQLDQLAAKMHQEPTQTLRLVGHTDSIGSSRLNLTLSEFRVKVTRAYLVRRGIASERILTDAAGDQHPAFPNDTELNRSRNRRVVMCRD